MACADQQALVLIQQRTHGFRRGLIGFALAGSVRLGLRLVHTRPSIDVSWG